MKNNNPLFSYRPLLLKIKRRQQKLDELIEYKKKVMDRIDRDIFKYAANVDELKAFVKESMLRDKDIKFTKSGGKSINLPDVAKVSVSKEVASFGFEEDKLREYYKKSFDKVQILIDKKKLNKYLLKHLDFSGEEIIDTKTGAVVSEVFTPQLKRRFTIRFTK